MRNLINSTGPPKSEGHYKRLQISRVEKNVQNLYSQWDNSLTINKLSEELEKLHHLYDLNLLQFDKAAQGTLISKCQELKKGASLESSNQIEKKALLKARIFSRVQTANEIASELAALDLLDQEQDGTITHWFLEELFKNVELWQDCQSMDCFAGLLSGTSAHACKTQERWLASIIKSNAQQELEDILHLRDLELLLVSPEIAQANEIIQPIFKSVWGDIRARLPLSKITREQLNDLNEEYIKSVVQELSNVSVEQLSIINKMLSCEVKDPSEVKETILRERIPF